MMDNDGGWWIWMSIWMVVFWGLVILGIVALVNWASGQKQAPAAESPEETLRRRLASGEIDEERYRALLDEVSRRTHSPTTVAH